MKLEPKDVYSKFRTAGISFYSGVPDSLLRHFCAFLDCKLDSKKHIIASNEGTAVGLAAGHYLSTGKPSLVYMQNSGIGNAINPFLSLSSPEVYKIPMIVLIGWRGEPNLRDEPQHMVQGRIMPKLLEALEIPWFELSSETDEPLSLIEKAIHCMEKVSGPIVLLVRKNTFASLLTPSAGKLANKQRKLYESIYGKEALDQARIYATGAVTTESLPENLNPYTGISSKDYTFTTPDLLASKKVMDALKEQGIFQDSDSYYQKN